MKTEREESLYKYQVITVPESRKFQSLLTSMSLLNPSKKSEKGDFQYNYTQWRVPVSTNPPTLECNFTNKSYISITEIALQN